MSKELNPSKDSNALCEHEWEDLDDDDDPLAYRCVKCGARGRLQTDMSADVTEDGGIRVYIKELGRTH